MKKSRFSLPMIISTVSLIIIVVTALLYLSDKGQLNDNKSKLTLLNTAKKLPVLDTIIQQNLAKQQEASMKLASNDVLLEQERVYTEQELNEMTEETFIALLKDTENRLPKRSDIKQIPSGALHRTPEIIIQAGRDLGLIKEILKIHESYERVALTFYKSCAKNEEGTTPVRALCLTDLIQIKKKNGQSININEFPTQLVELSKMVTDI